MLRVAGYATLTEFEFAAPVEAYGILQAGGAIRPVSSEIVFLDAVREVGTTAFIVSATLQIHSVNPPENLRLWIFNSFPGYTQVYAPFHLSYAEHSAKLAGYIDFDAPVTAAQPDEEGGCYVSTVSPMLMVRPSNTKSLFGVLTPKSDYTPASGQRFRLTLGIDQN